MRTIGRWLFVEQDLTPPLTSHHSTASAITNSVSRNGQCRHGLAASFTVDWCNGITVALLLVLNREHKNSAEQLTPQQTDAWCYN